jgi:hypothetical protein
MFRSYRRTGHDGHYVVPPTAHAVYPWFTAVYAGAVGALYWCIMVNGFVGFQLYEDGTPFSLWVSHLWPSVNGI